VERRGREPARYRLLESTRAYARALLEESGEREALAQRHAHYYRDGLRRAETLWHANSGAAAVDAFGTLLAEFHEVEAAVGWALGERHDPSLGGDLVGVLVEVWLQCCLGTGASNDVVYLLDVLQPSDVVKAARAPEALAAPAQPVDPGVGWLASFETRRSYRAGDVIFHKGDDADELLFIVSGVVRLDEIGVTAGQNELLGEIAFFSPLKQRTATATCATDVRVRAIDRQQMLQLYEQDAAFRVHVTSVLTRRLIEDLERVRSAGVAASR
jgi:hypothetical protein